jgi:AraC family transcriptional regulator, L-arginine-responsive activator
MIRLPPSSAVNDPSHPIPERARVKLEVRVLLLEGYSMLAVASLMDVIAALNRTLGRQPASLVLLSRTGAPVPSMFSDFALPTVTWPSTPWIDPQCDVIIVVGGESLPEEGFIDEIQFLRAHSQATLAGVGTGAWLLARAGLLDGARATIDWPYTALFAEEFPKVLMTGNLFEAAASRLTAATGTAAIDMLLALIGARFGDPVVTQIADTLGLERVRGAGQPQRVPLAARIGGGQPKLTEAVALMESNIAEPLPTEEIARLVGVSRRQLERLFKQHLQSLPSKYYLELRLGRARALLTQSSQSILQIGLTCGFSSGPHFSSAYRNHFGLTPREERSKRLPGAYRGHAQVSEETESSPLAASSVTPSDSPTGDRTKTASL